MLLFSVFIVAGWVTKASAPIEIDGFEIIDGSVVCVSEVVLTDTDSADCSAPICTCCANIDPRDFPAVDVDGTSTLIGLAVTCEVEQEAGP